MDLKAQTFTLEGVAASLLILIATYTVFQSTVILAPTWSEFENVQLKQLGYDILRIMDNQNGENSSIGGMLKNLTCNNGICSPPMEFSDNLTKILNAINSFARLEILCVENGEIRTFILDGFEKAPTPNAVRVSRFVIVENAPCVNAKVVEVRLTLWR